MSAISAKQTFAMHLHSSRNIDPVFICIHTHTHTLACMLLRMHVCAYGN